MNIEGLQEKLEQLASSIDWIKTKLVDLQEEKGLAPVKTPYDVEVPEDIDDYVYINNTGNTFDLNTLTIVGFEEIFKRGLAFKTREEAEQYDKERILINKMKNWAKEQQGDWTPNWNDDDETIHEVQIDRFPMYACDSPLVINEVEEVRSVSIFPYFYTYETARKFIEEFGDEIIEVLC